jgi:hypothetical protein
LVFDFVHVLSRQTNHSHVHEVNLVYSIGGVYPSRTVVESGNNVEQSVACILAIIILVNISDERR